MPSIVILNDKIRSLFKQRGLGEVLLLSQATAMSSLDFLSVENFVLTGNSLTLLMDYRRYPQKKNIRLWVLCRSLKKVLVEILGIPAECVGVIPRYELFERKPTDRLPQDCSGFVLAGRNGDGKNLDVAVEFLHQLQNLREFQFHASSFYLSHPEPVLMDQVDRLDWRKKPRFIFGKGPNWFLENELQSYCYLNFSTYRFEDYSVATAQAQSAGMPVITSHWQAFMDLKGQVWQFDGRTMFEKASAKMRAEKIVSGLRRYSCPDTEWNEPWPVTCGELMENFVTFSKKHEAKIRGYFGFVEFPQSHPFFQNIHRHFLGNFSTN